MDRREIEAVVLVVLAAMLKCEVDLNSSRHNTPQWDSLKHIEVIFAVEDELGLEFSEEEMVNLNSVAKIVELAASPHAA
jgi:acyl carrier protein